jgi:hypothetical protein
LFDDRQRDCGAATKAQESPWKTKKKGYDFDEKPLKHKDYSVRNINI